MKAVLAAVSFVLTLAQFPLAAAAEQSSTLKKITDSGVISVGHRTSSIPFSYLDENQKVIGFAADICNRIIEQIKLTTKKDTLEVRMIPVTAQNRMSLVQNGTVDIVCGVATNLKARQEQVNFATTYFIAGTRLLVKKGSGIKDFADLKGKTVVTLAGTTSERILRKMNDEQNADLKIQSAKEYAEAFLILESGRVAAFMMDDVLLAGARTLARQPNDWELVGAPQSFEPYGFMMLKDDTEFKKLVDGVIQGMMKDGQMATLYDKWFMKPVPPKGITFDFPMSIDIKKLYSEPNDKAFD